VSYWTLASTLGLKQQHKCPRRATRSCRRSTPFSFPRVQAKQSSRLIC